VNVEYELEGDEMELHDAVVSVPLPTGAYPTVAPSHPGSWSLNVSTHALDWTLPRVLSSAQGTASGSLEFSVSGDDASSVFPVGVKFVSGRSLFGVEVESVALAETEENVPFSQEITLVPEAYSVV